ncbi:hypothetical protein PIB30_070224 [Stylosanthes scabra]|uniref:Putative plant transposon protein domain-containing protein n=1 Tax=Stylosanthes scabra TaxID=79078 RepID=A0ABU6UQV5_9FABA|nr:hypothetical protein [Stylosanthes scabra]
MSSSSDMPDAHCFRTKEEIASGEAYPYKSYVRGVTIDFSSANIREILRIRDNTPGAETDYNTSQGEDQRLDEVIRDICDPGARWTMSSSQPDQPIQLKRQDLTPLARGWAEFMMSEILSEFRTLHRRVHWIVSKSWVLGQRVEVTFGPSLELGPNVTLSVEVEELGMSGLPHVWAWPNVTQMWP